MDTSKFSSLMTEISDIQIKRTNGGGLLDAAIYLAYTTSLRKLVEEKEKELKKYLEENGFDGCEYIPEVESKVLKGERKSTSFDTEKIGKEFQKAGKINEYFKMVNIAQKKIAEIELTEKLQKAIDKYTTTEKKDIIEVRKMNKAELEDYKKD